MSTNFYFVDLETDRLKTKLATLLTPDEMELISIVSRTEQRGSSSTLFIGKRSAAGPYCWDCRITLCKEGESQIHMAGTFHKQCPKCGGSSEKTEKESPVNVELGFSKPRTEPPKGVCGASSFTFHIPFDEVKKRLKQHGLESLSVIDEYDRQMTGGDFLMMIEANCPVHFLDTSDGWT